MQVECRCMHFAGQHWFTGLISLLFLQEQDCNSILEWLYHLTGTILGTGCIFHKKKLLL